MVLTHEETIKRLMAVYSAGLREGEHIHSEWEIDLNNGRSFRVDIAIIDSEGKPRTLIEVGDCKYQKLAVLKTLCDDVRWFPIIDVCYGTMEDVERLTVELEKAQKYIAELERDNAIHIAHQKIEALKHEIQEAMDGAREKYYFLSSEVDKLRNHLKELEDNFEKTKEKEERE